MPYFGKIDPKNLAEYGSALDLRISDRDIKGWILKYPDLFRTIQF